MTDLKLCELIVNSFRTQPQEQQNTVQEIVNFLDEDTKTHIYNHLANKVLAKLTVDIDRLEELKSRYSDWNKKS